nr:synaptogenesis protein syg-2-like [Lytechinus pictus]
MNDHGQYIQCNAYMDGTFVDQALARLMVYGPLDDIKLMIPEDLKDGIKINITCTAFNGYPAPLIHWYIGSRNVTGKSTLKTSINSADRYDAESTLILIPITPSSVLITDNRSDYTDGESVTLTLGRTHSLTCTVQGARPPPELEWQNHGGVAIGLGDQFNTVKGDTYATRRIIGITPSRDDDGKILTCVALHRELDQSLNTTVRVEVQVSPSDLLLRTSNEITITMTGIRSVTISENTVTSFICTSLGSRPTSVISWAVGLDVDPGRTTSKSRTNQNDKSLRDTESLLLLNPKREHHHQYLRCMATVGMNKRQTQLMVMVNGPSDPPILDGTQNLQDGVSSNVTCTAENGYPEPTFKWYLGSRNVTKNSNTQSSLNLYNRFDARSVLTLTEKKDDHGRYIVCQD